MIRSIEQKRTIPILKYRMSHGFIYYHVDNDYHNFIKGTMEGITMVKHGAIYQITNCVNNNNRGFCNIIYLSNYKIINYSYAL